MMKSSSSSRASCKLVSVTRRSVGHLWSYTSRTSIVPETTTTGSDRLVTVFLCACSFQWLSLASDPMEESHGDAESEGCARGFVTSSNPSAWPWQRCCTTRTTGCTPSTALHGARPQPPGPGEGERVTRRNTRRRSRVPCHRGLLHNELQR